VASCSTKSITRLWPLVGDATAPGPFNPPPLATARRPIPNLTFALNYRVGGLDPFGYHVVNLVLHVLAASLLAAIVRRTLRLPYFDAPDAVAWALAAAVALVWAVHPLNSESVVNVTQRTELLGGVCYLAAIWAALRYWDARTPGARAAWVGVAGVVSVAGMASGRSWCRCRSPCSASGRSWSIAPRARGRGRSTRASRQAGWCSSSQLRAFPGSATSGIASRLGLVDHPGEDPLPVPEAHGVWRSIH
jgi:hypothetical protein